MPEGSPRIIELLNDVLTAELTAIAPFAIARVTSISRVPLQRQTIIGSFAR
jgi:hypothetical protein